MPAFILIEEVGMKIIRDLWVGGLCFILAGVDAPTSARIITEPKAPEFDPAEARRVMDTISTIAGKQANIVAVCGESKGVGFYNNQDKFVNDGVSGQVGIVKDEKGKYDLIYSDGSKGFISTIQEGGNVINIRQDGNELIFLVLYKSGTNGLYLLTGANPNAKLIQVAVKAANMPIAGFPGRGRLYAAACYTFNPDGSLKIPDTD